MENFAKGIENDKFDDSDTVFHLSETTVWSDQYYSLNNDETLDKNDGAKSGEKGIQVDGTDNTDDIRFANLKTFFKWLEKN